MAVYMIAEIEVKDAMMYAEYVRRAREIVERHGGRYLARGKPIAVSGSWDPQRVILLEFESLEQLRKCFQSEEYRRIAHLRERSTTSRTILMDSDINVE